MATNNKINPSQWVDERLATLGCERGWEPDAGAALARFRALRDSRSGRPARWVWATVLSAAAGIVLVTMPAPRALAQRCLNCSVALWQNLAATGSGRANLIPETSRKPAPGFTLNEASGQAVTLAGLKGKVVLLNFWATWCHGCKTEIPWFMEFQQTYRNRGLVVLGVSRDDDGWKSVKPYISQNKVNYQMMIADGHVAAKYRADVSLPVTVLIDRSGRIAAMHDGVVRKNDCKAEIEALL